MSWSEVRRVGVLACALVALVTAPAVMAGAAGTSAVAAVPTTTPEATQAYPAPGLAEASGLTASVLHDGVVWVVEDSGEPIVRAYDPSGTQVGSVRFEASDVFAGDNRDTESLAMGPGPTLWSADIGDNNLVRETVLVHTTAEPAELGDQVVTATSYRFRFPDGPRDAETLLVDPVDGRMYVVSKRPLGGALYAAPADLVAGETHDLTHVQDIPGWLTGGAFAPDGDFVALRTWGLRATSIATIYDVGRDPDGGPVRLEQRAEIALPKQRQGESLAFTADGTALLVGSEGEREPIWSVQIPPELLTAPAPQPSAPGSPETVATATGTEPPSETTAPPGASAAGSPGLADRSTAACGPVDPLECLRSGSGWVTVALVGLAAALLGAIAVLRRR